MDLVTLRSNVSKLSQALHLVESVTLVHTDDPIIRGYHDSRLGDAQLILTESISFAKLQLEVVERYEAAQRRAQDAATQYSQPV